MCKAFYLFVALFAASVSAQTMRQISLADAKKYAVEHNYSIQAAKKGITVAESQITQSRSPFFPRLGVAGGLDSQVDAQTNEAAPLAYIYFNYNLFNGFQDRYAIEKSQIEKELREAELKRVTFNTELEVEKLFNLCLYKSQALDHFTQALEINARHGSLVRKRQSAGLASQSDAMEFELREAELKSQMAAIKQEKDEGRSQLVRLMGPDFGTAIEPHGKLPHYHVAEDLKNYLEQLKDKNVDIIAASKALSSSQVAIKASRRGWLPSLDIEGRAGMLPIDERPSNGGSRFSAMIVARWEFFSGFETSAKNSEAISENAKRELELKQSVLSAMTEVETLYRKLKSIEERIHVESQNESRAQKYYNSVQHEYTRGIKNGSDLKNAEESLLTAKTRRDDFKYEYLVNKLDLEKALGFQVATVEHTEEDKKNADR